MNKKDSNNSICSHLTFALLLFFLPLATVHMDAADGNRCLDYIRKAMNFSRVAPQEKVYLHFDNTGYFENETMWFKAYVVRTDDGKPSDMSRVLYVELLNPSGDVVKSRKLFIDEKGQANGEIKLDTLYGSGFYEVRAYTRYIASWGTNACFSRVFPIYKKPKAEGEYKEPTIATHLYRYRNPNNRTDEDSLYTDAIDNGIYDNNFSSDITVKFFPEGGDLIRGELNRMAVWAVTENGRPYKGIGQIMDARGEAVAVVETDSLGKGLVELVPDGTPLTLEITNLKKRLRRFELPEVKAEGCMLRIDAVSDEMTATICCSPEYQGKKLGYVIMNSGNIHTCDTLTAEQATYIRLDRSSMKEGVNQFTLFDSDGRILAERMFFICPKPGQTAIVLTPQTSRLTPCCSVKVEASTMPNTIFSFTAVDAASMNNGSHGNIQTWMLLSSEVKGYIPDIDYYFESDDTQHRRAADLLMLTQGWRRYDWELMTGQKALDKNPIVEDKFYLYGRLNPYRKHNKVDGVTLNAYLYNDKGESLMGTTKTDSLGNYAFDMPFFYDEWKLEIDTRKHSELKTYYVAIDRQFTPDARYITPTEASISQPPHANMFILQPDSSDMEEDVTYGGAIARNDKNVPLSQRNILLNNVQVKAKKRYFINDNYMYKNENVGRKWAEFYYDIDRELDKILDEGKPSPTIFEFLRDKNSLFYPKDKILPSLGKIPNPYYPYGPSLIWPGTMSYAHRPIIWVVDNGATMNEGAYSDDVIAYGDDFFPLWMEQIKSVYIKPWTPTKTRNEAYIYLYQHPVMSAASKKGIRHTYYQGFNRPETFQMEDYSVLPPMADFRRTLYWASNVKTDDKGQATIEFWNNSSCREMYISAEGVSADGTLLAY